MSNRSLRAGSQLAVALVLSACQDGFSAPGAETPRIANGPRLTVAATSVTTAVVHPAHDNVYVSAEGHRLVIPAGAICQPATSGYGPATWDRPCAPATAPIVFTITSRTSASGRPRIDVVPEVRFSPTRTVVVEFADGRAADSVTSLIVYCPTDGAPCLDESRTDASLRVSRNATTGRVSRRIKHFSGYHVILGSGCETDCDGAMGTASGRAVPDGLGASGDVTTTGVTDPSGAMATGR